jgi:hypothetical protein
MKSYQKPGDMMMEAPATSEILILDNRLSSFAGIDYSEEAIPERDPSYCTPDGTRHDAQTVDAMPPAMRLALVRSLEKLGMSAIRAAAVARL